MLTTLIVFDLLGWAIGLWLLWGPLGRRTGMGLDLLRGVALLGLGCVGAGALGIVIHRSPFASLRLVCHALFCVVAPLAVLRGIWWCTSSACRDVGARRWAFGGLLAVVGLSAIAVFDHASRVAPRALEVTVHEIASPRLAGLEERVRIVVLADLQTDQIGAYEQEVMARIDALEPDLLLLLGDYLQIGDRAIYQRERTQLRALLKRRTHVPRLGAFAVLGNTDGEPALFEGTGIRLLRNETFLLGGVPIQVHGIDYPRCHLPPTRAVMMALREFPGFSILLGHRPDYMLETIRSGSDVEFLALAGHTHGGQIVVPGFGPPLTLTRAPRAIAAGGLHRLGKAWMCVSRGVGMERVDAPRIRFCCPPELVVFDLRAAP